MYKIANTAELQSELQRLLVLAQRELPSRVKLAAELEQLSQRIASGTKDYGELLMKLQVDFADEIMTSLYKLLVNTHKSLADKFEGVSGFQNWDYGHISTAGPGSWSGRIWLKDGPLLASKRTKRELDGNLLLQVSYAPSAVQVEVEMGNTTTIFAKTYTHNRALSYTIAWEARGAWSDLLMS